jgi:hypothetical protein
MDLERKLFGVHYLLYDQGIGQVVFSHQKRQPSRFWRRRLVGG